MAAVPARPSVGIAHSRTANMAKRSRFVRWLPYIILLAIVLAVVIWIPASPA